MIKKLKHLLYAGALALAISCGSSDGKDVECLYDSDCGSGYVCVSNKCQQKQPDNRAPSANAGSDQTGYVGDTIYLDGTNSSDPDNDPLTYLWTQKSGPGQVLNNYNTPIANFTASATGTLEFLLRVCDNKNACAEDSTLVTILQKETQQNNAPIANAGNDQPINFDDNCYNNWRTAANMDGICTGSGYNLHNNIKPGETIILEGSGSDPDGDPLYFSWTQIEGPYQATISHPYSAITYVTFPNPASGNYVFKLEVSDGKASDVDTVTIYVRDNIPPVANAGADLLSYVGYPVPIPHPNDNYDPDGKQGIRGGIIKCHLNFGDGQSYEETESNAPDGNFDCYTEHVYSQPSPFPPGYYVVTLTVTDDNNATSQDICRITILP